MHLLECHNVKLQGEKGFHDFPRFDLYFQELSKTRALAYLLQDNLCNTKHLDHTILVASPLVAK